MKRALIILLGFAGLAILPGCGWEEITLKPTGDTGSLSTIGRNHVEGEFLAVQDSLLVFLVSTPADGSSKGTTRTEIVGIPFSRIRSVEIAGYSNRDWGTGVLLFELIPAGLISISASAYGSIGEGGAVFLVLLVPALLTAGLFELSTPAPPAAYMPVTAEKAVELRKYARFPEGIPPGGLEKMLGDRNQEAIRILE